MFKIIKQELEIDEILKRRLEIICDFCNTTPEIINGSIRKVDKTNLSYIEPHRIIIKNNTIINFISNKIFNKHDREKYMDVTTDLFENDLIENKTYDSIREDYEYSVKKDKNKDDFEIGM